MDAQGYQNRTFQKGQDTYRKDNRSDEKFEEDIEKFTNREVEFTEQVTELIKSEIGLPLGIQDNEGNRGQVIDLNEVDNEPDFTLYLNLEVKECQPKGKSFHLKTKQLKEYKDKKNCKILFLLGTDTEEPEFCFLDPAEALEKGEKTKWFGGKNAVKLKVTDFQFRDLETGERVERLTECRNEECDNMVESNYCSFDCMGDDS